MDSISSSAIQGKTIVRVSRKETWAVLDKYFIDEDNRLSWKATGILTYLLAKPDNWRVCVADIIKRKKDGEDSVYSGLKELEQAGYVQRIRHRDTRGRITGWEIVVYERPQDNSPEKGAAEPSLPDRDFPEVDADQPDPDFPDLADLDQAALDVADQGLISTSNKNNKEKDQQQQQAVAAVDFTPESSPKEQQAAATAADSAPGPSSEEIQELIDYAADQEIEIIIEDSYAGNMIRRAGSLDQAKEKIEAATAYIKKERRAGKKINSIGAIMNRMMTVETGGIKLGRDSQESKYKDLYAN